MYVKHPSFSPPETEDIRIWRYMDLTKFIRTLHTKSLYFCRADVIGDKFEGSWPVNNFLLREEWLRRSGIKDIKASAIGMSKMTSMMRKCIGMNCWHINDHESAAMWKTYVESGCGVAIQSTYKRLVDSFAGTKDQVYIGVVKYIDYERDVIDFGNTFNPFLYKRGSFAHEKELRALIERQPPCPEGKSAYDSPAPFEGGVEVTANVDVLIENIYLAPGTENWIREIAEAICVRFGIAKTVTCSTLDKSPLF